MIYKFLHFEQTLIEKFPFQTSEDPDLDPLDKALSACIENIIDSTETSEFQEAASSCEKDKTVVQKELPEKVPDAPVVSVFSIGPFPPTGQSCTSPKNVQFSNPLVVGPSTKPDNLTKEDVTTTPKESTSRTPSEVLDARAERLRNLEEQAQQLVKRVNATNRRGSALNSRLEELHETYGSMPSAPPMPDVLPSFRIRTQEDDDDDPKPS